MRWTLTARCDATEQVVAQVCAGLDKMSSWVDQVELDPNPQRFGNKAFRDWYKRVEEVSKTPFEIVMSDWWIE